MKGGKEGGREGRTVGWVDRWVDGRKTDGKKREWLVG